MLLSFLLLLFLTICLQLLFLLSVLAAVCGLKSLAGCAFNMSRVCSRCPVHSASHHESTHDVSLACRCQVRTGCRGLESRSGTCCRMQKHGLFCAGMLQLDASTGNVFSFHSTSVTARLHWLVSDCQVATGLLGLEKCGGVRRETATNCWPSAADVFRFHGRLATETLHWLLLGCISRWRVIPSNELHLAISGLS